MYACAHDVNMHACAMYLDCVSIIKSASEGEGRGLFLIKIGKNSLSDLCLYTIVFSHFNLVLCVCASVVVCVRVYLFRSPSLSLSLFLPLSDLLFLS